MLRISGEVDRQARLRRAWPRGAVTGAVLRRAHGVGAAEPHLGH